MRFDQKASQYHQKAGIQKLVADWCSDWIEVDCSKLVGMELGAGTGLFTEQLALRDFREFYATDISRAMIEEGRRRLPFVSWREVDAWNLRSTTVDRIYSCSLLQWADNPVDVLRNWRYSLVNSGRILACFFIEGTLQEFTRVDKRFSAIHWRKESEWEKVLRDSGLRILRSDTRSDVMSHRSPQEALRLIHDIGAIEEHRMSGVELRRLLGRFEIRESTFNLSWKSMRVECVPIY